MKLNINILIDLYKWVTDPINENAENEYLKNKIFEYYDNLPAQIHDFNEINEIIEYSYDSLITDMFNNIEYSNELKFKLLNNGRKYTLKCLRYVLYLFIPALIIPFFHRFFPINNYIYMFIIAGIVFLGGIIMILIEKVTPKILETMKPGDLFKILNAEDENFPIIKTEKSIGPNEYEKVTVVESKKKYICQKYRELVDIENIKNINKLMVYYFATDYLISTENNEEIITEYRKQITHTLEYILAFNQKSLYVLFYLAHNELNLLNCNSSLKYFKEYWKLNHKNINVNAWIIVLEFIEKNKIKESKTST